MVQLQIRELFENNNMSFTIAPRSNPTHYQVMMGECSTLLLEPRVVFEIRTQISQNGYALVSTDLPEFAPPTPTSLSEHYVGPYYGEAMLALIGQVIGELQSLSHQNDGRTFMT